MVPPSHPRQPEHGQPKSACPGDLSPQAPPASLRPCFHLTLPSVCGRQWGPRCCSARGSVQWLGAPAAGALGSRELADMPAVQCPQPHSRTSLWLTRRENCKGSWAESPSPTPEGSLESPRESG
ncbi:ferritin [Platysternon megacephalum]|uniref:Ferritin n=1 Tax=Platysternon megacephalum TaxID=55544 RepID=A0A4D9DQ07_9SAUR|nr:ferritin [Platysternon megacephalum]